MANETVVTSTVGHVFTDRGKTQTDPRNKCYPGLEILHRPHRAPPHPSEANYGFGNYFTVSTAFGRFVPSLLNMQFHGFHDATVYGTTFFATATMFFIDVLFLLTIIFLW
ncbi:hypothetical protein HN51_068566 [Arachis hypogaea]|nr:RING finger protein [Arachis hypogaea]